MLAHVKKIVALSVMALVATVISLPAVSVAATSPTVSVLSSLGQAPITPVAIALDASGNIYVASQKPGIVDMFNSYGEKLKTIVVEGKRPVGIAADQDGKLLVCFGTVVIRYDVNTGSEVGRLTGRQLVKAFGVAVDNQTGFIYVSDYAANEIVIYNAAGVFVKSFGALDAVGGKLSWPTRISFEKVSRQLYVSDTRASLIRVFDADGNYVKSIGKPIPISNGTPVVFGPMQFAIPSAITFEYSNDQSALNRIYIADASQDNVQVVDPATSDALLVADSTKNYIGVSGLNNGQLNGPGDAVYDAVNKRLFVVNTGANVRIFGIDGGVNPLKTDNIPPSLTVDPVLATVNVPGITISGTVEAGAIVTVTAGGSAVVGNVVFSSATVWKSDISGLTPGVNTISVTAKDAAGNTTLPQVLTTAYAVSAPSLKITSTIPSQTNLALLSLAGTVDAGSAVTVNNNATVVSGANWQYNASLIEGINNISLVAQKPYGEKTTLAVTVVLDTVAPLLDVSALADGSLTSSQVQNIAGTVTDANVVSLLVNNEAVTLVNNTFSVPVSLVAGTNSITVAATDLAGNSTVNSRSVSFDATAPQISVTSPMDNSSTKENILQVSGTVDETSTVTVSGVQALLDKNNWSATVVLKPGSNTIEVIATDIYGNVSSQKRTVTLDTVKPVLAISSPAQDVAVNKSGLKIAGTVSDSNATSVTYSFNGADGTAPIIGGSFEFKVDFVKDGVYPVLVTVTDASGNSTTATRSLIYDTVAPKLTVNGMNRNEVITGTVEEGATVTVNERDHLLRGVVVKVKGSRWSADMSRVRNYNKNKVSIVATDAAGNSETRNLKSNH